MKAVLLLLLSSLTLCAQQPEAGTKPPLPPYIQKIETINIPVIDFLNVSIDEAIEFLRLRTREQTDDASKGQEKTKASSYTNQTKGRVIHSLQVRDISAGEAVREICRLGSANAYLTEAGFLITPADETPEEKDRAYYTIYQHSLHNLSPTDKYALSAQHTFDRLLLKDIEIKDLPLKDALVSLGKNIDAQDYNTPQFSFHIIPPKGQEPPRVTLQRPYATLSMTIDAICQQTGYLWRITTKDKRPLIILAPARN